MSSYNPPSEDITEFNTSLFNQPEETLSQAEADKLYLSKTKSDISTASSTTFNGGVNVGGTLTGSSLIQSNTTSATTNKLFDNLFSGSTLTIGGTASTNEIRGNTTFTQNVSIKNKLNVSQFTNITTDTTYPLIFPISETNIIRTTTPGVTSITIELPNVTANEFGLTFNFFKFNPNLAVTFTTTNPIKIYTLNNLTVGFTSNTSLLSVDKTMTTLMCGGFSGVFYWIEVSNYSTFDRDYNNTIYPRLTAENSFSNRLNFSATSYSFPFASSQSLGYYLKATGTGTAVTSATPKTILTTASIPIGVWRVDFSVQNTTGATGGTITNAQSYIATSAASTTPLAFTGALVRDHISETYATGNVSVIASSFTLNVSTAQTYSLTILRTFAGSPNFTFVGEASFTRIA